jgi:CheY-like chemotaxis protein
MTEKYILLVEDNSDEVVLTERAFDQCQIPNKLVVVHDGLEALEFLFSRGEYSDGDLNGKPSLILLDLNLPFVSGLEVLKRIKFSSSTGKIPVVMLTSSNLEIDKTESYGLGADGYFCKPTSFSQFVGVVDQIKLKWLDSNGSIAET